MFVTLVRITLHAPHCHSLKERRAVVRQIKDRVQAKHKVSLAEVGGQDTWQRVDLGFAVVGSDARLCDGKADEVVRLIEELDLGRRVDLQREQLRFGEERDLELNLHEWVPDFAKGEIR